MFLEQVDSGVCTCTHSSVYTFTSPNKIKEFQQAIHWTAVIPLGMAGSQEALLIYLWYLNVLWWEYTHVDCISSYKWTELRSINWVSHLIEIWGTWWHMAPRWQTGVYTILDRIYPSLMESGLLWNLRQVLPRAPELWFPCSFRAVLELSAAARHRRGQHVQQQDGDAFWDFSRQLREAHFLHEFFLNLF